MSDISITHVMSDNSQIKMKLEDLRNGVAVTTQTLSECIKKQQHISDDIEKLKQNMKDKVAKAALMELNEQINVHAKLLGDLSRKIYEMKINLESFMNNPLGTTFIDEFKEKITNEILANARTIIDENSHKIHKYVEERIDQTNKKIDSAKKIAIR